MAQLMRGILIRIKTRRKHMLFHKTMYRRHTDSIIIKRTKKGTVVGKLELRLNGELLTEIPLAVETDIELDFGAELKEKLMKIVTSPWFIIGVCVFVALLTALIIMINIEKKKRKRARELNRRRKIQMAPRYNDKNRRK